MASSNKWTTSLQTTWSWAKDNAHWSDWGIPQKLSHLQIPNGPYSCLALNARSITHALFVYSVSHAFSSPEAALLLVSTENRDPGSVQRHSGFEWLCKHNRLRSELIGFVRLDSEQAQSDGKSVNRALPVLDLARGPQQSNDWAFAWTRAWFKHFRSISLFIPQNSTVNLSHSSHLGTKFNHSAPKTFFFRVLLLRQQPFSSENLPPERPTTTIAIKTHVSLRKRKFDKKFTIVAEIVSLLKKIYKRDAHFRAVFKVKTLAFLFSAYPREMKHIPRNLNLPPFWRCLFLWKWCNPFPRARARLKHAHSFDRCGG